MGPEEGKERGSPGAGHSYIRYSCVNVCTSTQTRVSNAKTTRRFINDTTVRETKRTKLLNFNYHIWPDTTTWISRINLRTGITNVGGAT